MDTISSMLTEASGTYYYYLVVAICILAMLYINDAFADINIRQILGRTQSNTFNSYGYDDLNGPAFWKNIFPEAACKQQSPINLRPECAVNIVAETSPLHWSKEYDQAPLDMLIYNTGLCVVMYTSWCGKRPTLTGGPFGADTFEFMTLRFRWGPNDLEGTEHMISYQRYALEMQAAYVKTGCLSTDILKVARNNGLVMISYVFRVTETENPYIEPIISALRCLKYPSSSVSLNGIPMSLLAPTFCRNYFSYTGSLTFPPCTEGVRWIVLAEPLFISSRQVRKFRKLYGCNLGPLSTNCRPVQMVNNREVLFYC